jgi:hypothetical protein
MLACLALGLGVIALFGVAGNFGVIASRLDTPAINDLIIASKDWQFPKDENFQKNSAFRLVEQPGTTKSTVLFIGDSHVEQYFPRVKYLTSRRDLKSYSAVFATHEGCPPIPNINLIEPGFYCHKFSEFALDEAKKSAVARVVFGGFWERYFIHEYSAPGSRAPVYYIKDPAGRQVRIDDALGVEVFRNFAARISSLRRAGKRVYIILPNPTAPAFEPHSMLIDRLRLGHAAVNTNGFISKTEFQHHVRPMTAILKYIAESTGSTVFDPLDYFCEDLVCRTNTADGKPKYRDSDHLRSSYAETRATFIDQIILHQPNAAKASHLVTEISPKSLHEPTF